VYIISVKSYLAFFFSLHSDENGPFHHYGFIAGVQTLERNKTAFLLASVAILAGFKWRRWAFIAEIPFVIILDKY